jgi:hypothetical protein
MLTLNFLVTMTFLNYLKLRTDKIQVNLTEGVGIGILYP